MSQLTIDHKSPRINLTTEDDVEFKYQLTEYQSALLSAIISEPEKKLEKKLPLKAIIGQTGIGKSTFLVALSLHVFIPEKTLEYDFCSIYSKHGYHQITRKITYHEKNIINASIIVASKAIIPSILETYEKATNIGDSVLKVDFTNQDLFIKFVTRGTLTRKYIVIDCDINKALYAKIIEIGKVFKLVMYDDFSIQQLSTIGAMIPGLCNIIASSVFGNEVEWVNYMNRPKSMSHQPYQIVDYPFIINIDNNFVKDVISIPRYKAYEYVIANSISRLINLIKVDLPDKGKDDILECLNSGDYDRLGSLVESESLLTSPLDLFKHLQVQILHKISKADTSIAFINNALIEKVWEKLPSTTAVYQESNAFDMEPIMRNHPDIKDILISARSKLIDLKVTASRKLLSLIEKITQSTCCVCESKLNSRTIIVNCCCSVFCHDCLFMNLDVKDIEKGILGACPNCKSELKSDSVKYFKSDEVVKISKSDILISKMIDTSTTSKYISKNMVIMSIIKNINLDVVDRYRISIKNITLLQGDIKNKGDEIKKRVFVIVSSSKAELNKLKELINEEKLVASFFHPSFKYSDEDVILLESQHAFGVNMQDYATDIIICHTFANPKVESQVLGRLQRMGRKTAATIHYIRYDHEEFDHKRMTDEEKEKEKEEIDQGGIAIKSDECKISLTKLWNETIDLTSIKDNKNIRIAKIMYDPPVNVLMDIETQKLKLKQIHEKCMVEYIKLDNITSSIKAETVEHYNY